MTNEAKTKHTPTPPPWRVESNKAETVVQVCGGNDFDTCVVNLDFEGPHGEPQQQSMANARLIAAAPDLLAICEHLLAVGFALADDRAWSRLRAAVTKAGAR